MSPLARFYVRPQTVDRILSGWLGPQIERYVEWMASQGYSARTIYRRVPAIVAFGEFALAQGVRDVSALPPYIESFLSQCAKRSRTATARQRRTFLSQH